MAFFNTDTESVVRDFESDARSGLSPEQVKRNAERYGTNEFTRTKPKSLFRRIFEAATEPHAHPAHLRLDHHHGGEHRARSAEPRNGRFFRGHRHRLCDRRVRRPDRGHGRPQRQGVRGTQQDQRGHRDQSSARRRGTVRSTTGDRRRRYRLCGNGQQDPRGRQAFGKQIPSVRRILAYGREHARGKERGRGIRIGKRTRCGAGKYALFGLFHHGRHG